MLEIYDTLDENENTISINQLCKDSINNQEDSSILPPDIKDGEIDE